MGRTARPSDKPVLNDNVWSCIGRCIVSSSAMLSTEDALRTTDIDPCAAKVVESVALGIGVEVDEFVVRDMIAPICNHMETSDFLALTLMKTSMLHEIVGERLARVARGALHNRVFTVDLDSVISANLLQCVMDDLVQTRKQLIGVKCSASRGDVFELAKLGNQSLLQCKKKEELCSADQKLKNIYMPLVSTLVKSNMAFKTSADTVAQIATLSMNAIFETERPENEILSFVDKLPKAQSLARHMRNIDSAIDLYTKATIDKVRCLGKHNSN